MNGAGVPLVRECNDICLRAKYNNICTQDFSLGSPVMCPNPLDGGFHYKSYRHFRRPEAAENKPFAAENKLFSAVTHLAAKNCNYRK
jgi:hypothetical protein